MNTLALLFSVCWPLLLVAGLVSKRGRGAARTLAPWAALPGLLAGTLVATGAPVMEIGWLMLGGRLGIDDIANVLLPVTAGLWLAAGLFAQRYLESGPRRDVFFGWFLAAMAGNLLLLVALDAAVFYLGFALMSFASYGLVVHAGNERARHAGRYYIVLVVIGEVCIISALMMLASSGHIDFAVLRTVFLENDAGRNNLTIGLLLIGFGIKAGVFGLHFWLPLAHPVAPAPASAVLSGAMIKAGLVAWLRLLPLGEVALPAWGAGLAVAGLFTAYYGVFAGLPQREAKTVLAYSSISQMGLVTLAIGLGLVFPAQWPMLFGTVLIFMVHHSLVKGGLFLGAGLVQHALSPAAARLAAVVLSLGALAIAGGPLTGGLVAKLALKQTAELVAEPWSTSLPMLLSISSALTTLLMLRFLWLAWPRASAQATRLPFGLYAPWLALLAAWLAGPWLVAAPVLRAEATAGSALWDASWPLVLAGVVAFGAVRLHRRGRLPGLPPVPAGDIGILLERGVLWLGAALHDFFSHRLPRRLAVFGRLADRLGRSGPGWAIRLSHGETRIAIWPMTGLLMLLLAASLAWLLA